MKYQDESVIPNQLYHKLELFEQTLSEGLNQVKSELK